MVQGDRFGFLDGDAALRLRCGRLGSDRRGVALDVVVEAHDAAVRRGDVIIVLQIAIAGSDDELDLIHAAAVIVVALRLDEGRVRCLNTGVVQSDRFGFLHRDLPCRLVRIGLRGIGLCGNSRRDAVVFLLKLDDLPCFRVHVAVKFIAVRGELHVVDHRAIVGVQTDLIKQKLAFRYARPFQRDRLGLFLTDVALLAGCADDRHLRRRRRFLAQQQIQLIDGQRCKLVKGMQRAPAENILNKLRLTKRDAILLRHLLELAAPDHGLAQHRGAERVRLEQPIDLRAQARLQVRSADGIVVIHTDQDGVRQLIEVGVLEHRADQSVDRHIQAAAGKVHIADDDPSVLIQRLYVQHPFLLVDLELHAGVDIQRDRRVHHMIHTVAFESKAAPKEQAQARRRCDQRAQPCFSLFFCCHGDYTSFLFITIGKNGIQYIRRSVFIRLPELFIQLPICHHRRLLLQVLFQPFDGPVVF